MILTNFMDIRFSLPGILKSVRYYDNLNEHFHLRDCPIGIQRCILGIEWHQNIFDQHLTDIDFLHHHLLWTIAIANFFLRILQFFCYLFL